MDYGKCRMCIIMSTANVGQVTSELVKVCSIDHDI